jgi:hypothetical protein
MNKKIFVLVVIVMSVFLQQGSLAGTPGDFAVLAQTYDINGTWVFRIVEMNQHVATDVNALILGWEKKTIFGYNNNMDCFFSGIGPVNGDRITIDPLVFMYSIYSPTPIIESEGKAEGKIENANYMRGTWSYKDGSQGGTWEGTRNSSPPSPGFDIRGNWFICLENEPDSQLTTVGWAATFSGSKEMGNFRFAGFELFGIPIEFPKFNYSINGDEVTITFDFEYGSLIFSGKIINGNMLYGQYTISAVGEDTVTGNWAAILWALPGNIPPFGSFDSPEDKATVYGSIAVTGWALANRGIDNVKIYREQGSTLVYVGDAVFIEGARPDVAEAYSNYLFAEKAGWGYMLLTNFLPNSGNGTFVLHAVATDLVGNTKTLGTKTIYCDNEHAVKPFGAIDTPGQGGTASGSDFINWGWVLTPQPNYIPTDGSTINVFVDGLNIGHPNYNIYRDDIANLFPGYANSNGAIGYFNLDTTAYDDGLHTIHWTATDSAGNTDGIGSRYFMIGNQVDYGDSVQSAKGIFSPKRISETGLEISSFNLIEQHLKPNSRSAKTKWGVAPVLASDPGDIHKVIGKELEPVEIPLGDNISEVKGYLLINNRLRDLPAGSTLDARTGKFYWSPGPGFLGKYSFVFEIKNSDGRSYKKSVEITLEPKFKGPRRNH